MVFGRDAWCVPRLGQPQMIHIDLENMSATQGNQSGIVLPDWCRHGRIRRKLTGPASDSPNPSRTGVYDTEHQPGKLLPVYCRHGGFRGDGLPRGGRLQRPRGWTMVRVYSLSGPGCDTGRTDTQDSHLTILVVYIYIFMTRYNTRSPSIAFLSLAVLTNYRLAAKPYPDSHV